jgi:transcriptional regulator with GAF, ATPase, and Fis domain
LSIARAAWNQLKRRPFERLATEISVVATEKSVNALEVVEPGLHVIGALLAAVSEAHTPRSLVRAIAMSLSSFAPLRRVELRSPAPVSIVERAGDDWSSVDPIPSPRAEELVPGLAVVAMRKLPADLTTPEFRAALAQVIATATRHMSVVQRVATLSRRAHVESRELRADLQRLEPSREIVARSEAMQDALARAHLVAAHPTSVLLTGDSGSGKEVLAREIHQRSPRARRPMVQVNCGAIPEGLIESELFGHERGAFTGADRLHVGVFERAHRGTLFLDEVGELPLAAQVKLLRVLQERQIRRVGGTAVIDVDVRLIAATNRSLTAMVADGTFREDLYYRLAVFAIRLPALRERRGDLAPLVHQLVGELSQRLGIEPPPVTRAVLAKLEAHDWPGNVRELMNVLEAALILGGGRSLDLPEELSRHKPRADGSGFESAVRQAIEESLRATRGKIYGNDGAAARLGLKPATLQSKMQKLGIRRRDFC